MGERQNEAQAPEAHGKKAGHRGRRGLQDVFGFKRESGGGDGAPAARMAWKQAK
jgi:hypothetical protein